ncbi:hypothetical protein JW887_01480 [Candidatus Dojkabacteria bacterium]|nr:hypothetical protein [Candidatus Dojkabacteria bacterium]
MKKLNVVYKLIVFSIFIVLSFLFLSNYVLTKTEAYDTTCPSEMTDEECLEYLQEQANLIGQEKSGIQNSINQEDLAQMDLSQQIAYFANQVKQTELEISEKEVEVESLTVEIRLLNNDINDLNNSIDTMTQEINTLETDVRARTKESYKMTYISPVQIFIDFNDLDSVMMQVKFLMENRKKDLLKMDELIAAKDELDKQEEELNQKKKDVEDKRQSMETTLAELATDRINLESQKAQQQVLLAESQRREQEYQAQLSSLESIENSANQQIGQLIMRMYEQGQLGDGTTVSTGNIIGFQGHTGCSFGSHLHFSVNSGIAYSGWGYFYGDINPYNYINSSVPMVDSIITQGYHQGMAVDMVSGSGGNQSGGRYCVNPGELACAPSYGNCSQASYMWFTLRGEGAPIKAIAPGKVYYGVESWYGGKFAMVVHDNGYVSIYLHIQ